MTLARTALRQLLRHGGSAAAWSARDRDARQWLQRAGTDDDQPLGGADDWAALLLQSPLDAAAPALQTMLDTIARGAADLASAQQREAGRRLVGGAAPASLPRHAHPPLAGAGQHADVAMRTGAAQHAHAVPAAPATLPETRLATALAGKPAAPPRARVDTAADTMPARHRRAAANDTAATAALAQWRRRAADAGLTAAFDSVVRTGTSAAALLLPETASPAPPRNARAVVATSPVDRIDAVLGRIAGGIGVAAQTLTTALPAPGSGLFQPAPVAGIGGVVPLIEDALAGTAQPLPPRGGFRGLAEHAARAAGGASSPPAQPASADSAARTNPRDIAASADTDDDLAARIARILRRAAERDGVDLDDVQPT